MTIIRIEHARSVFGSNSKGYCNRGMRAFAAKHNLDWESFVYNGVDTKLLSHIDDEMLNAVIAEAEKDEQEK